MPELKIIYPLPVERSPGKARLATLLRCALVVSLALCIRVAADRRSQSAGAETIPLAIEDVAEIAPNAGRISKPDSLGMQHVQDSSGNTLAIACRTLPTSRSVIGYQGPADVLLLMDNHGTVTAAKLISSEDTIDHVKVIQHDAEFFRQFEGWTLGDATTFSTVDATSGATLTALAIAESVAVRLGGEKPSLRFPDDFRVSDLELVFPDRTDLSLRKVSSVSAEVFEQQSGTVIGRLFRTGPLTDSIAGYQGPSELLLFVDDSGLVKTVRLRKTFENEPYAGYLNEEGYFWRVFQDKKFADLRNLDLEAEQVEGVSGATMTSLAVADAIVAAAQEYHQRQKHETKEKNQQRIHWTHHDSGTAAILLGAVILGTTRLRGIRWLQIVWLVLLIGYFGLVTGNLISIAVLSGWAAKGFAWKLAPGLAAVMLVSLLLPPTTKRNIYCTHICPHGAAQQLIRRIRFRPWRLTKNSRDSLRWFPGILLVAASVLSLLGINAQLSAWEPFSAWIWYVAGPAAFALAGMSLLFSAVVPMGWCRYGCMTGRLLEYVRHSARADQVTVADMVLLLLTVCALSGFAWS